MKSPRQLPLKHVVRDRACAGGSLWCGAGDCDPLASPAARDWQFCAQASGRRHALTPDGGTAIWETRSDISLAELLPALIEVGLHVSVAGLHRFFVSRGMTRKKRLATRSSRTGPTS
jgi:hypothetical protein